MIECKRVSRDVYDAGADLQHLVDGFRIKMQRADTLAEKLVFKNAIKKLGQVKTELYKVTLNQA